MGSLLGREPVTILAAVRAIIVCAVAFGLSLSPAQMAALFVAIEAVLAVITRQVVTPMAEPRDEDGAPAVLVAKASLPAGGRL